MSNTLGFYNPLFYAQEALIQLQKALGMASRVHLGFDAERRTFNRGDTINISKPATFVAQDAPSSAQDLNTGGVSLTLSRWKEVKFSLTDKELAFTSDKIIKDHITPAAYALADDVDQFLVGIGSQVPWVYDLNGTRGVIDMTTPRQILFDNKVPLGNPQDVHYMMGGQLENEFLQLSAFTQYNGAGSQGAESQRRGTVGERFGFETFANQNVTTFTGTSAADPVGALSSNVALGAKSFPISGVTASAAFKAGDTFVIAGNTQRYCVAADATADGSGNVTLTTYEGAVQAYTSSTVVTIKAPGTKIQNLAFHRNFAALAFGQLSEMGNELGAKIASVQDPVTGLAIRSRLYYVGDSSAVKVALDILYGGTLLDGNKAVRIYG